MSTRIVGPSERLIVIVGNYGSGKTEVAVNLALRLADRGVSVQIADLDLVNPYFRCREAARLMTARGIRVVVPPGPQRWADLPIVMPEIRGMLHPTGGVVSIFDVGGDDTGARALASFRPDLTDGAYELWQIINANRPFTEDVAGCLAMQAEIEAASRLTMTGLVVNSHLIEETSPEVVLRGWRMARAVSARNGLPIRAVAVMDDCARDPELAEIDAPLLIMRRTLLPPWVPSGPPTVLGRARERANGPHRD